MTEIIPAIIGSDFGAVKEKIKQVAGRVNWVQLDIMDGLFVPESSWRQPADLEELDGKLKIEAHLMVENPERTIAAWLSVCDRVLVHPESTEALGTLLEPTAHATEIGLALLLETPLERFLDYLKRVKTVQLMAIATIGHHGEPLDEQIYERIKLLRASYPNVKINIDGGVTLANAPKLIAAGADRLVVGSAIWEATNLEATINALQRPN